MKKAETNVDRLISNLKEDENVDFLFGEEQKKINVQWLEGSLSL